MKPTSFSVDALALSDAHFGELPASDHGRLGRHQPAVSGHDAKPAPAPGSAALVSQGGRSCCEARGAAAGRCEAPVSEALSFQPQPGTLKTTMEGTVGFSRRIGWNGGSATARLLRTLSGESQVMTNAVELHFVMSRRNGSLAVRANGNSNTSDPAAPFGFVLPVATDVQYAARHIVDWRVLRIELDPAFILRACELNHFDALELTETLDYRDPLGWQIAQLMFEESVQGAPEGILYSETAATLLAVQLIRTISNAAHPLGVARRGGLPPALLKRARDYMTTRLSDNISLREVAQATGLSSGHFAVAFKRSMGVAPHAWLRRQRIEKAKDLLADLDLDLTAVAMRVGYANQSALGVAFKRETGLTPTHWRWRSRR